MTNESLIEELYWEAHSCGVFNEFHNDISEKIKNSYNVDNVIIVEDVHREYIKRGFISESCNINRAYH